MLTSQTLSVEKSLAVSNTKVFLKVILLRDLSFSVLASSLITKVMAIHAKSCYIINKK